MNKVSCPKSILLSDLIDLGYSECFAVQLDHEYEMDDGDFFLFDTRDRQLWGATLMAAYEAVMHDEGGKPIAGYASEWLTPMYRLICVPNGTPKGG